MIEIVDAVPPVAAGLLPGGMATAVVLGVIAAILLAIGVAGTLRRRR